MTRQRPEPLSITAAEASSVPTLDLARGPSPLVSCLPPALPAGDARGGARPHGRHRPPVTIRVDRCRPAVTVSTIVVSTLRRRPPPRVRPRLLRSADSCRVHNIRCRLGAGFRVASIVPS